MTRRIIILGLFSLSLSLGLLGQGFDRRSKAERVEDQVEEYVKLSKKSRFLKRPSSRGRLLSTIDKGVEVGVVEQVGNYYFVVANGQEGYIAIENFPRDETEVMFEKIYTQYPVFDVKPKTFYRDGKTYQYFVSDGVSVTMELSVSNDYGKYYVAAIAIENLSGKEFDFDPQYIKAIYNDHRKDYLATVYSLEDYLSTVSRKQNSTAALLAFGESFQALNAGRSTSTTTTNSTGFENTYGSGSGYFNNSAFSISGNSTTFSSGTSQSTTTTYDAGAAYQAQQQVQKNIQARAERNYQIRNQINRGYLKLNTIFNEDRVTGQIFIDYEEGQRLKISVPVNGVIYNFDWEI